MLTPRCNYRAKVDNAATANPANLKWFKIQEEGLYDVAGQKWAVDKVISNKAGKYTFTVSRSFQRASERKADTQRWFSDAQVCPERPIPHEA